MNAKDFIAALGLPQAALLHQRVPKKAFLDHGKLSPADKKLLSTAVEDIWWEASIKPTNVAIPTYNDGETHCEEIQIFQIVMREAHEAVASRHHADAASSRSLSRAEPRGLAKTPPSTDEAPPRLTPTIMRIANLLHRQIPYPLIIFTSGATNTISLARKRASLTETDRVVLQEHHFATIPDALKTQFLQSLNLANLSHLHLQATYEGWLARVIALQAATTTGHYKVANTPEDLAAQRAEMDRIAAVQARIRNLRAQAKGERSIQRLADINLEIKRLEQSP